MPEQPSPEILENARQWLAYADEDMDLAQHAHSHMAGAPSRLVAYHAQQCAEKCLKAYLVCLGVDFPYTHNIARLLELCIDTDWCISLQDAEELTPFAIAARYPGLDEQVSEDDASRAIEIAERVRDAVHERLMQLGV
jgi:HEPN domain-containing protein